MSEYKSVTMYAIPYGGGRNQGTPTGRWRLYRENGGEWAMAIEVAICFMGRDGPQWVREQDVLFTELWENRS